MSQTRSLPVKSVSSLKRQHVAEVVWTPSPPHSERDRARQALAFLTCRVSPDRPQDGAAPSSDLDDVIYDNWVIEEPIVYEEFPPWPAAGIFSAKTSATTADDHCVATLRRMTAMTALVPG